MPRVTWAKWTCDRCGRTVEVTAYNPPREEFDGWYEVSDGDGVSAYCSIDCLHLWAKELVDAETTFERPDRDLMGDV